MAIVELSRFPNDIFIGIAVLIGMILSIKTLPPPNLIFYGFFSGFLISASVMVANDIFDLEIDRINNPNRPLPSGAISIKRAKILVVIYMGLGLLLSMLLTPLNFGIALIFWVLGILYNKYLKKRGLIGNMIVSASVAIPFIYGAVGVIGYANFLSIIFSMLAFLLNTGREIIKGIIDLEGDKEYNVKTLAVTLGAEKASFVASLFIGVSVLLSPLPALAHKVNTYYYLPLVAITDILFIYSVIECILIVRKGRYRELHRTKTLIFIGMGIGLLAFLFGAYFV